MISLKVLSTAAVMALVLPMAAPSASFAQNPHGGGRVAGAHPGGGHPGGFRAGGGARFSGGGGYRGGYRGGGGGGFIPGAVAGALVGGAIAAGGGYGYYGGPGYYDQGQGYYDQGYYGGDPAYYNNGAMAQVPGPGGDDAVAYCTQRFRSYDPQSGSYLGNDGARHPCP